MVRERIVSGISDTNAHSGSPKNGLAVRETPCLLKRCKSPACQRRRCKKQAMVISRRGKNRHNTVQNLSAPPAENQRPRRLNRVVERFAQCGHNLRAERPMRPAGGFFMKDKKCACGRNGGASGVALFGEAAHAPRLNVSACGGP